MKRVLITIIVIIFSTPFLAAQADDSVFHPSVSHPSVSSASEAFGGYQVASVDPANNSNANNPKPNIPTYIIGIEDLNHYPYFSSTRKNSVATDILDGFAEQAGMRFIYHTMSIKQLYWGMLVEDKIDFKFPDHPSWGEDFKQGKVFYSRGVVEYVDGIVSRTEREISSISQLKVIGAIRGMTLVPYLETIEQEGINVLRTSNVKHLIAALMANRVDGIYYNVDVLKRHIKKDYPELKITFSYSLPYQRSYYRLSTAKHPKVIAAFDQYLKQNAVRVEAIKRNYGLDGD